MAGWASRVTHFAAVEDDEVGGPGPPRSRDERHELPLHVDRIIAAREAEAIRDAKDVGVHGDSFSDPEGVAEDNVGGLAPDPRELHEKVERSGDLAAVLPNQCRRAPHQALRLGAEEAGGADDLLQLVRVGRGQGRGCRVAAKKHRRDHVDPLVRALR